jgi:hypothetical protein
MIVDLVEALLGVALFAAWIFLLWRERKSFLPRETVGGSTTKARLVVALISALLAATAFRLFAELAHLPPTWATAVRGFVLGFALIVVLVLLATRGRVDAPEYDTDPDDQEDGKGGTHGTSDRGGDPPGA